MMKRKKSLLAFWLVCLLTVLTTVTTPNYLYASKADTTAKPSVEFKNDIPNVVNQYLEAINNKDWNTFVKSYSPERQNDYNNFPSQHQIENRTGILSVDSVQIYESKKLPSTHITQIEPYFTDINYALYDNIQYYYIGLDYKVNTESEFFYNGVKYELLAIGSLSGEEYIIGHESVYDLDELDAFGYTFNSDAERKAQNIVEKRERGIIVNFYNDTISSNVHDSIEKGNLNGEDIQQPSKEITPNLNGYEDKTKTNIQSIHELNALEKASQGNDNGGFTTYSATSTPSTIKLYITSTGTLQNIAFDTYTKNVLPNEWYSTWKSESLKAGAIAIKTYAWYNATYPRKPASDYGAHLTDKWENYQHYVPNSGVTSTNNAVNAVSGIFMRNTDGKVFDAQYRAGTSGDIGTAFGGVLSQHGTQYIANTYPEYDYYTILSYYYSFSDKSSGYIQTGSY
ncbi:SpoIID/LytB domain-containing protein [Paenibacillus sp. FA6]|uniref:SpoIID/LytB domain-containing protein n=1 Tax=Paenibacillus sp. FA6 TaxID=3413029 RepID=UPI003F657785